MPSLIKSISIVIPAFNEEKRIMPTIQKIYAYLKSNVALFEIFVVDDGSSDNTREVVNDLSGEIRGIKLLSNESNRGKGFSVRSGVLNANCALILLSDADLSTPIEEVEKLLPYLEQGYDIVIGSRGLKESDIIKRQAWYRQLMGKTFNLLVKTILFTGIEDTQCGFKLFKTDLAKKVFGLSKIDGFAFDVELLLIAKRMGYRIKEVPVRWINSPQSRVRIVGDSFKMFIDLLRIRLS